VNLPSFYYDKLTWEELQTAISQQRVVIIPIGSTEQHGKHLPVEVDNFLARSVAVGAAELVPDDVLVMPNIAYGFNTHHMDFPGQITISGRTFIEYCLCITRSLAYHGFKKIILLNAHGSNMPYLDIVARHTMLESKGQALCAAIMHTNLAKDVAGDIRESPLGGMGHACEWETSMLLHLNEDAVRKEKIEDEYGLPESKYYWNELQNSPPVSMMEWWSTFSLTGVSGNPSLATKDKGKQLYETTIQRLAEFIREFKAREIRPRRDRHDHSETGPAVDLDFLLQF
jgi:creatinine amidohydrolase